MRELTPQEIAQVSAGPTTPGPIDVVPQTVAALPRLSPQIPPGSFGHPFIPAVGRDHG